MLLGLTGLVAWAAIAVPTAVVTFLDNSRQSVVAGHDAVVSPTLDGWAVVHLGPFLPGLRHPTPGPVGVSVELGRTPLTSYGELGQHYAFIAAQPEGQIAKVGDLVRDMALEAAVIGALAGLVPVGVWLLLGARRRRELVATRRRAVATAAVGGLALAVAAAGLVRPWQGTASTPESWSPLATALPAGVDLPTEAQAVEIQGSLLSSSSRRLVESAIDSYRKGLEFYQRAIEDLGSVAEQVRRPEDGETVAVLVSDRHDNIGMDPVARAVADVGGATVLLDAGDDTSTGSSWEAFSLESLDEAFSSFDERYLVTGNHDHGSFVAGQASDLGFTVMDAEVVEAGDGNRFLGVADPRSSGLGNWREESGLSFAEVGDRLADTACAADEAGERVGTLLVHDANLGAETLARGCTDLVVAGHLHDTIGPEPVVGANGHVGHRFTTGTTGGAAYAVALGTKPRREATVSLLTYRDGAPMGVQSLVLSPLGAWTVDTYVDLTADRDQEGDGPESLRGE